MKHNNTHTRILLSILAALLLAAPLAVSATDHLSAVQQQESMGTTYLSGGFGSGERKALQSIEKDYSAKVVFSLRSGHVAGNVNVVVMQSGGKKVFNAISEGPWLYLDLPSGSYTMEATYEGQTCTKNFSAPSKGLKMVHCTWSGDKTGFKPAL